MEQAEFEAIRQEAAKQRSARNRIITIFSIVVIAIALIISIGGMVSAGKFELFFLIMPAFFSLFIITFAVAIISFFHPARKALAKYRDAYKQYFVKKGLEKILTELSYLPNQGISPAVVRTVMTTGDRYSSNDYLSGKYKGINLFGADVHTEREHTTTDSNGNTTTTYITIFKGKFFVFDFNRDFAFRLQLVGRGFSGAQLSYEDGNRVKYNKIETESVEFNKHFKIYAQNGQETFYILDPSFMEKIQSISEKYKKKVLFSFIDKKLYVAINDNKDSFEVPRPDRIESEEKETEKVNSDIAAILQFVDTLMLERYAFWEKQ